MIAYKACSFISALEKALPEELQEQVGQVGTDKMALLSKRRTISFAFVALLIVVQLADHSQGIMGWFGNAGKRPNGRRSLIKV